MSGAHQDHRAGGSRGSLASVGPVTVAPLRRRARETALRRLRRDAARNLFLIDLVHQVGGLPRRGEPRAEVLAASRAGRLVGVAAARPSVAIEAGVGPDALAALVERLALLPTGLIRSPVELVAPLWEQLAARGRRALVDRPETAHRVGSAELVPQAPSGKLALRPARSGDLDALVEAARASLREEGRPDPFEGDPRGFRSWVQARISRALVGDAEGKAAFVGYADVQLPEGWLLQGVYTWPRWRGRGLAAAGVSQLCATAFARGADHVQLSVVDGNRAANRLYAKLGFRPFAALRTLLYA